MRQMRFLPTPIPPHLATLIAKAQSGHPAEPRYLPKLIKPRGAGKSAANWVADSRR
jgi:hypothetical protein